MAEAENRPRDAAAILTKLHQDAEVTHNDYFALRLGAQLSTVWLGANQPAEAANAFRGVLSAAARAGIYQTILDRGLEIGALLVRFQEDAERSVLSGEFRPYVGSLIARWNDRYQPGPLSSPSAVIAESLSARERNVLELIGQGQSNKEIARDLGITPETVKSHVEKHLCKTSRPTACASAISRPEPRPDQDAIGPSGTQLIQELVHDGLHAVTRYQPQSDKVMRMHAQTAMIENGFVHLPDTAPWLAPYLHELTVFPHGRHDDQVELDRADARLVQARQRPQHQRRDLRALPPARRGASPRAARRARRCACAPRAASRAFSCSQASAGTSPPTARSRCR